MRIIGIDLGDARTGLAISDESEFLASPIGTLNERNTQRILQRVIEQVNLYGAKKIVLGYPKNMNGTIGQRAEKTKLFADMLKEHTGLEVVLVDERRSTVSAQQILNSSSIKGKNKRKVIDTISAVIILQTYLDSRR